MQMLYDESFRPVIKYSHYLSIKCTTFTTLIKQGARLLLSEPLEAVFTTTLG